MLKLCTDGCCFDFLPVDAYRARIEALFKTYGVGNNFASFWVQGETAAVCRVDGCFTVCAGNAADFDEIRTFLDVVGYSSVCCDFTVCSKLGLKPTATSYIVEYTNAVSPVTDSNVSVADISDYKEYYSLLSVCGFSLGKYGDFLADFCSRVNNGAASAVGIFSEGKLVAGASALFVGKSSVLLGAVATDPEYRGKGYARILVSALAQCYFPEKRVFLFCRNDSLLDFYTSFGFEGFGKWCEF